MTQSQTQIKHCRQESETATLAQGLGKAIAKIWAANPSAHLNLALEGDLGAGKTTFARFLIQGLGHTGKVKSPTYTLCEPYLIELDQNPVTIHHFDLYRMRSPLEWQEAGFAEYFDVPGLCLIEWPEKAENTLPPFDLVIRLTAGDIESERVITLNANGAAGTQLLEQI
ncbi:tRNA (adenosine(37)-N6)-threonylcarbamoyltransferase complex ATPase subunit type 1 TsaE [Polynucleobacter paludilacus]|uniref:tRNA (adenosine(37)-N6)-threonylcarbamoyltransferase complex ATPase subunit type 1 TsaE n=1 Tax=Polynucleobacter paludilacus TaxID=1855895 RepID=UPI001BFCF1A6|nr:tRNA (adenosine(37)-N6)-threonylcarbamoyltransferase complex ATPase subunit type 1 TsaE [Polynucleobacter paludilacus]QWD87420.1 tRNA (adenosine(37)-N6)-threonylcarbamoyltransferase complex ATPase subunit type 1 TsaE [Polynucleobacter paludilacus]